MLTRLLSLLKYALMSHKTPKNPLLVVLGATGTGKSQLAIELAKKYNGEIINGDAMQLYHGLPIVTNKVTTQQMQGIPHHLLGVIGLEAEPWRVGTFRKEAVRIVAEIRGRGKVPVLVGGTHYYTQSLVIGDGIIEDGGEDGDGGGEGMKVEEIREKWPVLEGKTEDILEKLREVDPVMADRWHPKDRRKIRRSLEIFLMTGRKASDIYREQVEQKKTDGGTDSSSTLLFWIHAESKTLKKRLDGRIDKMLESGMLDEVKSMDQFLHDQLGAGQIIDRSRGIWVSIGWKEFEPYLRALKSDAATKQQLKTAFDLSIEQTKAATRQYAKRQTRWIRLKLLPALSEQNALKQIYLLDGTSISAWDTNVSHPALEIGGRFLSGEEMPDPESICEAAKEILGRDEAEMEVKREWPRRECEVCGVVAVTEVQWETHLKSRKHRGVLKRIKKREGMREREADGGKENEMKEESGESP